MELLEIEVLSNWYAKKEKLLLFSLFCIAVFAVEIFLAYAGLTAHLRWSIIILFHCLLSLICLAVLEAFAKRQFDIRLPLLLAILVTFLGPVGAGMTLLITCFYFLGKKFLSDPGKALLEVLYPDIEMSKSTYIYNRITYGMEDTEIKKGTASYQDIMSFGSTNQKRNALEKIGRYFRPEFVPALQMALNDTNSSIRVYAGTIFTQLDAKFYNLFQKLEKLIKANPDNPHYMLAYAQHGERYVNSKILAPDRASKMRNLTVDAYQRCLAFAPHDLQIQLSLARLYLDAQQYDKSLYYVDQLMQTKKTIPAEAYLILMQIYYAQHQYDKIRQLSHKDISLEVDDPDTNALKEMMAFWK